MDSLPAILLCVMGVVSVQGHGMLVDPPSRSMAGKAGFPVPINYDANGLNCGGHGAMTNGVNQGRCGVCGDEYSGTKPNEPGPANRYASGIVVKSYTSGSIMEVTVDVTATHKGYFEYRLCVNDTPQRGTDASVAVPQSCFQQLLAPSGRSQFKGGETRGKVSHRVQLPQVECSACVLQWRWVAGNNWGCIGASCGNGMGSQEEFWNCADIRIVRHGQPLESAGILPSQPSSQSNGNLPVWTPPNHASPTGGMPNTPHIHSHANAGRRGSAGNQGTGPQISWGDHFPNQPAARPPPSQPAGHQIGHNSPAINRWQPQPSRQGGNHGFPIGNGAHGGAPGGGFDSLHGRGQTGSLSNAEMGPQLAAKWREWQWRQRDQTNQGQPGLFPAATHSGHRHGANQGQATLGGHLGQDFHPSVSTNRIMNPDVIAATGVLSVDMGLATDAVANLPSSNSGPSNGLGAHRGPNRCYGILPRFQDWCAENCLHESSFCPPSLCWCEGDVRRTTKLCEGVMGTWCTEKCNHTPPFCPADVCQCEVRTWQEITQP